MLDDCVLKLGNYPIIKAAFFIYLLFLWFVPTFALHTALVTGHRDVLPCNYLCADFHSALRDMKAVSASCHCLTGDGDQAAASLSWCPERGRDDVQRRVVSWGCIRPGPSTEHSKCGCNASKTSPQLQLEWGKMHVLKISLRAESFIPGEEAPRAARDY